MARFSGGWIKLHRELKDKDISQNIFLLGIWTYLLLIANYKPSQIIWKGKQRILEPGQCLLQMREMSEKWDCSTKTVWKWLHYLHDTGRIALESEPRGTVVTICNWREYQFSTGNDEVIETGRGGNTEETLTFDVTRENYNINQPQNEDGVTPSKHQVNAEETPSKHQVNNSEEDKKERKKEEKNEYINEGSQVPPRTPRNHLNLFGENEGRENSQKNVKPKIKPKTELNRQVRERYNELITEKYGMPPLQGAKLNSQISTYTKQVPDEDAIPLLEFFLKSNDRYYIENTFGFGLLLRDVNKLNIQMKSGAKIIDTRPRWGGYSKAQTIQQQNEAVFANMEELLAREESIGGE